MNFAKPQAFKAILKSRVEPQVLLLKSTDSAMMYAKAALFIAWAIIAYIALIASSELIGAGIAAFMLALALTFIAFNIQHDGNHGAFSRYQWVNRLTGINLDLIGASSYFWSLKHNHNHHMFTNIPGKDVDIEFGKLAHMSEDHQWYWHHQYQHLYIWLLYCFVHLRYLYSDVQRILFGKRDSDVIKSPKGTDLALLLSGKVVFLCLAFAVPMLYHKWYAVIGFYIAISMCMGLILSVTFQLAHSVDIVDHPRYSESQAHEWTIHQIRTTANFATSNKVVTFLLGGLNFQREHHLYPRLSHVHYPLISARLQEICAEHNVPCPENKTLLQAIASHYRFLKKMGTRPV